MLPHIKYILSEMTSPLLKELYEDLDTLEDLCTLIKDAIKEDPPLAMKEGGIIRDGYNPEVDKLRSAKSDGKDWLAKLESDEREKTGIKNLKIKYNKSIRLLSGEPILLKIWFRIIIQESRPLPMQSVILFRN